MDYAAAERAFLSAYPGAGDAERAVFREIFRRALARYGSGDGMRAAALSRLRARGLEFEDAPAFPWIMVIVGFVVGVVPGLLLIMWHESRSNAVAQRNMQRAIFAAQASNAPALGPEHALDWLFRNEVATMFQEIGEDLDREAANAVPVRRDPPPAPSPAPPGDLPTSSSPTVPDAKINAREAELRKVRFPGARSRKP